MEQNQTLFETLSVRYGVGFSQQTADSVTRLAWRDTQLLDIKELNDLAAEYRNRLRCLIASYRAARGHHEESMVRKVYANHESIFMRRQLTDLWQVYRIVVADSHEMTKDYLRRLRSQKYGSTLPPETEYRKAA